MKKIVALLLSLALALSCISLATAEETTVHLEEMGFAYPESFDIPTVHGYRYVSQNGVMTHSPYIATIEYLYILASPEEIASSEHSEELKMRVKNLWMSYGLFIVSDAPAEEVVNTFNKYVPLPLRAEDAVEFATENGYHYYYFSFPADTIDSALTEYAQMSTKTFTDEQIANWKAEFSKLSEEQLNALKGFERMKPYDPAGEVIGKVVHFDTVDVDGKPISSEELFAANKITMINVWGTWCPNCLNEMNELAQMHLRLKEKGCGIVGLDSERAEWSAETAQLVRDTLSSFGITYPNVLCPAKDPVLGQAVTAYPCTIFVDSQGKILTYPILGAMVSEYEKIVDMLLKGEPVASVNQQAGTAANSVGAYRVYVFDDNGPVPGAVIQFCSDTTCSMGKTDENGLASFSQPEGKYVIHVLVVPDGYEPVKNEFKTMNTFSDVNIFLTKTK